MKVNHDSNSVEKLIRAMENCTLVQAVVTLWAPSWRGTKDEAIDLAVELLAAIKKGRE